MWQVLDKKKNSLIFTLDLRKLPSRLLKIFFLSEAFFIKQVQNGNITYTKTRDSSFLFKNHLLSTLKVKSKSRKNPSSYLLCSLLSLCSSQKRIPAPVGLPFTGRSDLARPHSTRGVVLPGLFHQQEAQLPFLTFGIQQTVFPGHQQRDGKFVSFLNGLSFCQVPKQSRPSLRMLNICSSPSTSGYLV